MDTFSTTVDHLSTVVDCEYQQALYPYRMNMGGRIKLRLEELGWGQIDLLNRVPELEVGTLSALITRDSKRSVYAPKIAAALGIRLEWLISGEGIKLLKESNQPTISTLSIDTIGSPILEWSQPDDLPPDQYVIVPRYDLRVAAGNGHVVYDELELDQGKAYRTDYIRDEGFYARHLLCLRAIGDSMEPSIKSGDTLLIDRNQNQVQDRNVYVLRYGDEIRVKRLYRRPDGGLRIVSDNPLYPEEIVTAADMHYIEIIGRVVERSGRM